MLPRLPTNFAWFIISTFIISTAVGHGPRASNRDRTRTVGRITSSASAVLVAESPQLGGVQHHASQTELTALLNPLNETGRLRNVRSEMEKVGDITSSSLPAEAWSGRSATLTGHRPPSTGGVSR